MQRIKLFRSCSDQYRSNRVPVLSKILTNIAVHKNEGSEISVSRCFRRPAFAIILLFVVLNKVKE